MRNQQDDTIRPTWRSKGFNADMQRTSTPESPFYGGASFDGKLDEMILNRMIQFKNLPQAPQGNDKGKVYYDPVNKKLKMWIGEAEKWVELIYTSTSTSTSSSSSSSSITTTSSSTSVT